MKYYEQTAPRRLALAIVAVFSFWLGMTSMHVWQLQQQQIAELEEIRAELTRYESCHTSAGQMFLNRTGHEIWCHW